MGTDDGSLCAYGPTSEVQAEYVFSCYGGPKRGRSLTIYNKYSSGIKLCEVKLMGKNKTLFYFKILHCIPCVAVCQIRCTVIDYWSVFN